MTVTEGSTTKRSKVAIKNGSAAISLIKLKKGKHTFTVSYTGEDLQKASNKFTITEK